MNTYGEEKIPYHSVSRSIRICTLTCVRPPASDPPTGSRRPTCVRPPASDPPTGSRRPIGVSRLASARWPAAVLFLPYQLASAILNVDRSGDVKLHVAVQCYSLAAHDSRPVKISSKEPNAGDIFHRAMKTPRHNKSAREIDIKRERVMILYDWDVGWRYTP